MQDTKDSTDRIALYCPECQAKLRAPRALLGKKCPCPRCRSEVIVRAPIPTDADIILIEDEPKGSRPR